VRACLASAEVDVILLAGFMKKLGPETLRAYLGRILNTRPALLPKFGGPGMYGMRVHRAVLAADERTSGASVHRVDVSTTRAPSSRSAKSLYCRLTRPRRSPSGFSVANERSSSKSSTTSFVERARCRS
jgi:Formyl transferase